MRAGPKTLVSAPTTRAGLGTTVSTRVTRAGLRTIVKMPAPYTAQARVTTPQTHGPHAGAAGGCAPRRAADLNSTLPATGAIGAVLAGRKLAPWWSGGIMWA